MLTTALTYLLALVIGVALGMLGGGGSILTVPVFTYVAHLDPKVAIASSLPVVAVSSAFGAVGHWRAGNVHLRTALTFGVVAMAGGFTGARIAQFVPGQIQLLLFSLVMLGAAFSMLRGARGGGQEHTASLASPSLPLTTIVPLGLGVGMLTGVVGVGGGFLIVPALAQVARLPMRAAVGTSLMVITMNAAAGTAGYIGRVDLPFGLLVPFTSVAVIGILAGTGASQRVPQQTLRRAFAVLLLLVAAFILVQNRSVFGMASMQAPSPFTGTTQE